MSRRARIKAPVFIPLAGLLMGLFTAAYWGSAGKWLHWIPHWVNSGIFAFLLSAFVLVAMMLVRPWWMEPPDRKRWAWFADKMGDALIRLRTLQSNMLHEIEPGPETQKRHANLARRHLKSLKDDFVSDAAAYLCDEGLIASIARHARGVAHDLQDVFDTLNEGASNALQAEKAIVTAAEDLARLLKILEEDWPTALAGMDKAEGEALECMVQTSCIGLEWE